MTYIPTKEQTVDFFTKELHLPNFKNFIYKLDMINIYNLTWEEVLTSKKK